MFSGSASGVTGRRSNQLSYTRANRLRDVGSLLDTTALPVNADNALKCVFLRTAFSTQKTVAKAPRP